MNGVRLTEADSDADAWELEPRLPPLRDVEGGGPRLQADEPLTDPDLDHFEPSGEHHLPIDVPQRQAITALGHLQPKTLHTGTQRAGAVDGLVVLGVPNSTPLPSLIAVAPQALTTGTLPSTETNVVLGQLVALRAAGVHSAGTIAYASSNVANTTPQCTHGAPFGSTNARAAPRVHSSR